MKSMLINTIAAGSLLTASLASAQSITLPGISFDSQTQAVQTPTGVAGSSLTSPNALGGLGTSVFLGGTLVNHWTGEDKADGSMSFGVGFGNAKKTVGVSIGVLNDSLGDRTRFFKNAGVSLRLNRYINNDLAVAAGVVNAYGWNDYRYTAHSFYVVATKAFHGSTPVVGSIGAGTGTFASIWDVHNHYDGGVFPFASLGAAITQHLSVIGDFASKRLAAGFTYAPAWFKRFPIAFNAAVLNVTGHPSARSRSLMISGVVSYSFQ